MFVKSEGTTQDREAAHSLIPGPHVEEMSPRNRFSDTLRREQCLRAGLLLRTDPECAKSRSVELEANCF